MKIPKDEKIEEETSKEFLAFIKKIEETPTQNTINIFNNYRDTVNQSVQTAQTIARSGNLLLKKVLTTHLNMLDTRLKEAEENSKPLPPKFSLATIKGLENVKDCFMENKRLIITTNKIKHKEYIGRDESFVIKEPWFMPEYRIEYLLDEQPLGTYEDATPERFIANPKSVNLGYVIKLNDPEDIDYFSKPMSILCNNNEQIGPLQGTKGISPYLSTSMDYDNDNGVSAVCFGENSSTQEEHVRKNEILPHANNLIKTLHTTDVNGRGYSKWIDVILKRESITRTLQFKEKFGKMECIVNLSQPFSDSEIVRTKTNILNSTENYANPLLLKTNKELLREIQTMLMEKEYKFKDEPLEIIEITHEDKPSFNKTGDIINIILGTKIYKTNEEYPTTVQFELTGDDFKNISKIITPKGDTTFKKFNSITKNLYATNTTL